MTRSTTSAPALPASSASSSRDSSTGVAVARPDAPRLFHSTPTRIARSRAGGFAAVAYASESECTGTPGAETPEPACAAAWELTALYECGIFCVTTVEIACLKINCS
jgi:hypothetical protein